MTHRNATLRPPQDIDLRQLALNTGFPLLQLQRFWNGRAPSYFQTLLIEYHTNGRCTPEHFRAFLKPTPKRRPKGKTFHGEALWGSRLARTLAAIIIESGLTPAQWLEKHQIPSSAAYSMLLSDRIPRRKLVQRFAEATADCITAKELYDPAWRIRPDGRIRLAKPQRRKSRRPLAA